MFHAMPTASLFVFLAVFLDPRAFRDAWLSSTQVTGLMIASHICQFHSSILFFCPRPSYRNTRDTAPYYILEYQDSSWNQLVR